MYGVLGRASECRRRGRRDLAFFLACLLSSRARAHARPITGHGAVIKILLVPLVRLTPEEGKGKGGGPGQNQGGMEIAVL